MFEFLKSARREGANKEGQETAIKQGVAQELKKKPSLKKLGAIFVALAMLSPLFSSRKAEGASVGEQARNLELDPDAQKEGARLEKQLERQMAEKGFRVEISLPKAVIVGETEVVPDAYQRAYQDAQSRKESYREVSFRTINNRPLPLRDFLNGLGIKINTAIYQYLDQDDYRAVFCYRGPNAIDRGLILNLKRGSDMEYYKKVYYSSEGIDPSLEKWEPTIFSDLKNIFFPESILPDKYVAQFQTTTGLAPVEYATRKDQKGNNLFIGYAAVGETLFLANSLECQREILKANAPPGEP